jgi:superfamily II DNA or RNA helicase/HKD family nuclease
VEELAAGLYELLLTERLAERVEELKRIGRATRESKLDNAEAPAILARHIGRVAERVLELVKDDQRIATANELLRLANQLAGSSAEADTVAATILTEIGATDLGIHYARPQIPLARTDLLVNARGEPVLAHEIAAELTSADRVDLLCAFIKWQGLRLVIDPLQELCRRGIPVHVITTTYVGATERRAVDELVRIGAEVKVSYETQRTRLHAKAWLFHRNTGFDTAYIGSSNLSRSALVDGLEWNVRIARPENPAVLDKFKATFDAYWNDPSFESYDPERDGARLDAALGSASRREPLRLAGLEVRPFAYQQDILERLDAERHVHDRWRNLVVAATGTGKTVIAALDYRRLRDELGGDPRLLFVAHRREILDQSQATFAAVLGDGSFGEQYVAGQRPEQWHHVFASIQSLTAHGIERIPPDHFDVVIVDEFHHAAAATYRALLEHLQPKVLLGLTATPERADGEDITHWFGGHIAAELRLWDALEQELLCPFHYFGVADQTDLTQLEWKRGGYSIAALEGVFTGNDARARIVLRTVNEKVSDPATMRALGFCVSQAHAAYMAQVFNDAGLPSVAIDANTPEQQRLEVRARLTAGELRCVFSVDLFNEGLDVPRIDTVLFLRPTESATVFLQQLGRGLRHAPGKACLTVLDFIGQQHRRFRFDDRLRHLTGIPRAELPKAVEDQFPFLPSGCHIELDRVSSRVVLDNIRQQVDLSGKQLVADVKTYGDLRLAAYLERSGRTLEDIYRKNKSWTGVRRAAGFPTQPAGPDEEALLRRVHRFLAVDDPERIDVWRHWLTQSGPPAFAALPLRQQRLAAMFLFTFWARGGFETYDEGFAILWRHPNVLTEIVGILDLVRDQIAHVPIALTDPRFADVPLWVHSRYSRDELLAGLGYATIDRRPAADMQGVRYVRDLNTDVFTFTLQKAERDYSPTTMYRDYAISPTLVHWETQNNATVATGNGRRYLEHRERDGKILLFARETNDDPVGTRSFLFLGEGTYVSHEGDRPIGIVWRLEHAMPAAFFTDARVVAG